MSKIIKAAHLLSRQIDVAFLMSQKLDIFTEVAVTGYMWNWTVVELHTAANCNPESNWRMHLIGYGTKSIILAAHNAHTHPRIAAPSAMRLQLARSPLDKISCVGVCFSCLNKKRACVHHISKEPVTFIISSPYFTKFYEVLLVFIMQGIEGWSIYLPCAL